jgi:O-methyltransferase
VSFIGKLRSKIGPQVERKFVPEAYEETYERFREFTMIRREVYADNLELAKRIVKVPGCIVECGVWRGGMIAGMAALLGGHRHYYLFDSFEGLPPAKEIDGKDALNWQWDVSSPNYYDNCKAPEHFAEEAMKLAGAPSFELVKGWFEKTLPGKNFGEPIALLRLDADWYDSTMVCLEHLFEKVAPGGLIMLDDYYTWDGCSRALHDFLSRRSAIERIRNLGEIAFLVKAAKDNPSAS